MNIKRSTKELDCFSNVPPGSVFHYINVVYVKIEDVVGDNGDTYNAVSLDDGDVHSFDNEDLVKFLPNAYLVTGE